MEKKYTDIIFDVDGTLIDTESVIINSLSELLEKRGMERKPEDLSVVLGIPGVSGLRRLGFPEEEIPNTVREWLEMMDRHEPDIRVIDGITGLLDSLRDEGYRLGIVTSRDRRGVWEAPSMQPLAGYFEIAVTQEETDRHKPYPDPILCYARKAGTKPENVLYVGDSIYDMECAKAAGADAALAVWGAPGAGREIADLTPETPAELQTILTGTRP